MGEKSQNNVRALREAQLMSKAELARKAGLSPLTIDRVESGKPCRMDTKRKLILALGLKLADRHQVFPEEGAATPATPSRSKRQRTREGEGETASGDAPPAAAGASKAGGPSASGTGAPDSEAGESPSGEGRESGGGRGAKSA